MNKKHTTLVVLDFALAVAIVILVEGYLGSTSALAVATFVMFGHRLRALEARNKASDRVTVSVIVKPDVMSAVAYGDQDPKALVEAMEKIKVEFDKHINVTNTPPPQAPPKLRACEEKDVAVCTCDAFCDDPCPVHHEEHVEQDRRIAAQNAELEKKEERRDD